MRSTVLDGIINRSSQYQMPISIKTLLAFTEGIPWAKVFKKNRKHNQSYSTAPFCLILRQREEPVRWEWDRDQFKSRNC